MALDRQRILGELGSVMKQLQNADCGCLGKLFGTSQQAPQSMMGSPLPTCGGCRRACCHGHGCGQYYPPNSTNQPTSNVNYMSNSTPSQQPMSGNMHGFGPQIVNMMKSNHIKSQNVAGQGQRQIQGQMQQQMQGQMQPHMQGLMQGQVQDQMNGQLAGSIVIDAPQSPHGKVGLTPLTPPSMIQQGAFNSNMNQGDIGRHTHNQFIPQPNAGNVNPAAYNMQTSQSNINGWPQQNMASNYQTSHSNPHSQHSKGIAKFHKMFPGVKQGMGGDLGFDPMAIAIQMNPENHLQSAMNSMNKIMNGSKGIDHRLHKIPQPQPALLGNAMQQITPVTYESMQQNAVSKQVAQGNINQMAKQPFISNNVAPSQVTSNQQHAINPFGHPIPQQNQEIYAAAADPNAVNQQMRYENDQQIADQQQYQQGISDIPNLPVTYEEQAEEILETRNAEPTGYPNQLTPQQMQKEPIFPVDSSRNQVHAPPKQQKINDYVYNTLGQPIEMLPAKLYHPPEPSLPQTLSPQPAPVKPKGYARPANVKATVSKTSLMGNKPVGKTPSRAQLQHIYNQYKGSQSFTQQNVRHPSEGTYSDGRLNIPQSAKTSPVPVERVGGDTIVNNPPQTEDRMNKVEQVIGQIGDVAATKPAGDSLPVKGSPDPVRKCRNGLQDMVFSSYPASAAWTFHGHGRNNSLSPTRRFQNRRYL